VQRPGGVGIYTCDDVVIEVETKTCPHCSCIIDIPNRRRLTDYADICRLCDTLICVACAGKPCIPWLKKIEQKEAEYYRQQQFAISMGFR